MAGLLEQGGTQPKYPTHGAPIHIARMETGLFTNRNPLHDPAQFVISKFYGGYVDALIDGSNMEISNKLTLIRRPGLTEWSNQLMAEPPNWFYEFRKIDGTIEVIVDMPSSVASVSPTAQSNVLTKSAGAGQGYFQGVGDVLYIGDGVDLSQYIPSNPRGTNWQWGIAAPTSSPSLVVTESGSASSKWLGSTVFSTMGFLVDANGNVQQLVSVNADGSNPNSQVGVTSGGGPIWNQTPGGTTTDGGSQTWTNFGPVSVWIANHTWDSASIGGDATNPCIIYDPVTNCCFYTATPSNAQGTSGGTKPNFVAAVDWNTHDPAGGNSPPRVKWWCFKGTRGNVPPQWQPSHSYTQWGTTDDKSNAAIVEPVSIAQAYNPLTNTMDQDVFLQVAGSNATSGSGGNPPAWSTLSGTLTLDGQLSWVCLGTATWSAHAAVTSWGGSGQLVFTVIKDSNGNMQVCTISGTTDATQPSDWATTYGAPTPDGSAQWTCVGPSMSWATSTAWFLPTTGFAPPSTAQPYGGASVIDSNGNVQYVIASGKSGTMQPTWSAVGSNTTDSGITWFCVNAANPNSLSWTKGFRYGVAFKARTASDFFVTNTPPGLLAPLGPPTGSGTGHVSTISPINVSLVPSQNAGAVITLSGIGSTNPAVDTICIFRTLDGGSDLFELTEIPNPAPINGVAQPWSFQDYQPDTIIDVLIPAPVDDENDPPPAGFLPMEYYFQRVWGSVGNTVYFSGGPDVVTGNPNESFAPVDSFVFPSQVVRILGTPTAILVFTTSDIYGIMGGPGTASFYAQRLVPGVGLAHYNALDIHGGLITLFSADKQLLQLDPSSGVNRIGFPVADKLAAWDATKVYVTQHEDGNDNAIFTADGSTGWYRLNPSQAPNGNPVWSPKANITNGCQAVLSIEVSKGVHKLLVGGTGDSEHILMRDLSATQDDGVSFSCFFTMGSINVCNPGQIAGLTFTNLRCTRVGTAPTVSFLLNEVSGTFTNFPAAQAYPWQIYGNTTQPTSLFSNAYYFRDTGLAALAEHLQIKVSFPAEAAANEALTLTLYGVVAQPPEI